MREHGCLLTCKCAGMCMCAPCARWPRLVDRTTRWHVRGWEQLEQKWPRPQVVEVRVICSSELRTELRVRFFGFRWGLFVPTHVV